MDRSRKSETTLRRLQLQDAPAIRKFGCMSGKVRHIGHNPGSGRAVVIGASIRTSSYGISIDIAPQILSARGNTLDPSALDLQFIIHEHQIGAVTRRNTTEFAIQPKEGCGILAGHARCLGYS